MPGRLRVLVWTCWHRRWTAALALAVAVVTASIVVDVARWRVQGSDQRAPRAAAAAKIAARLIGAPVPQARSAPITAVLMVNVPGSEWEATTAPTGYAFVVRRTGTWSDLITDYHLVVNSFLAGERSVELSDGVRTYGGEILAVSSDPHVARIRVTTSLPTLTIAWAPPKVGDPVLLRVGEDKAAGSGEIARSTRAATSSHLTFSVTVPPGLDGAPLLDRRGRVVGLAEPSNQFADARLGYAVPIRQACAAVRC